MIDRQKVGELPAEQGSRLAMEIVGELARHVGQGAERVGLPEPPATAVLEFVDEVQRLLCLPFDGEPGSPGKERVLGDEDAVDDHQHRQHVNRKGDLAVV